MKENALNTIKTIVAMLILFFVLVICFGSFLSAKNGYRYKVEHDTEIIETKVEYLGDAYEGYLAEPGYEMYKMIHTVKNNTGLNLNTNEIRIWYEAKTANITVEVDGDIYEYDMGHTIPAGMKGIFIRIIEVPVGTKGVNCRNYENEAQAELWVEL